MIEEFIHGIGNQMGLDLSEVSVKDGERIGCNNMNLLCIGAKDHVVEVLVYKSDIASLQNCGFCDRLEVRILIAISRLKTMWKQ